MKIKVNLNKKLVETLTREIIAENKSKKAVHKKEDKKENKKDLKESEMLNESPMTEFFEAVKLLSPDALAALAASALPITAAIKIVLDTFKKDPKDPSKTLLDRLRDMGKRAQQNR